MPAWPYTSGEDVTCQQAGTSSVLRGVLRDDNSAVVKTKSRLGRAETNLLVERFKNSGKAAEIERWLLLIQPREAPWPPWELSWPHVLFLWYMAQSRFTQESQRRLMVSVHCLHCRAPGPHQSYQAAGKTNKSWLHLPAVWRQQPVRSTAQECAHKRSISLCHDSKTARPPHAACDFPKASVQILSVLCHTLFPRIGSQGQRVKGTFKQSKLIIFSSTLFMETVGSASAPLCLANWLSSLAPRVEPTTDRRCLWGSCSVLEKSKLVLWNKSFNRELGEISYWPVVPSLLPSSLLLCPWQYCCCAFPSAADISPQYALCHLPA